MGDERIWEIGPKKQLKQTSHLGTRCVGLARSHKTSHRLNINSSTQLNVMMAGMEY